MFLTKKPKLITRLKSSQGQPCGPGQNPGRDGCRAADGSTGSGGDSKPKKPDSRKRPEFFETDKNPFITNRHNGEEYASMYGDWHLERVNKFVENVIGPVQEFAEELSETIGQDYTEDIQERISKMDQLAEKLVDTSDNFESDQHEILATAFPDKDQFSQFYTEELQNKFKSQLEKYGEEFTDNMNEAIDEINGWLYSHDDDTMEQVSEWVSTLEQTLQDYHDNVSDATRMMIDEIRYDTDQYVDSKESDASDFANYLDSEAEDPDAEAEEYNLNASKDPFNVFRVWFEEEEGEWFSGHFDDLWDEEIDYPGKEEDRKYRPDSDQKQWYYRKEPCGQGQNPSRDGCTAEDGTSGSGASNDGNSDKKIEIKKPETIDEFSESTSGFIEELDERFYDTFEENPIATVSSDDVQEMNHSDFLTLVDDAKDNLKVGLVNLRSDFMDLLDLEEEHHKNLLKEVDDAIKDTLSFFKKQTDKLIKLHEKKYEKQQIWENLADNEPPYTYDENHPDWVPPPEEPNAPDYHDIEEPIEPDIQDYTVYSGDEVDSIEQEQFDADMSQYEIDRKKYDEAEKAYEDAYAQYEQDYDKWHDEFTEWEDTLEKREVKAADDYEAWEKKKDKAEKDYDKAFEKADEFHTNLLEGLQEKQNDLNENLLSDFARDVQTYYEDLIEERDNQDDDETVN